MSFNYFVLCKVILIILYFVVDLNARIAELQRDLDAKNNLIDGLERELAQIERSNVARDTRRAAQLESRLKEIYYEIQRILQEQSRLYVQRAANIGVSEETLRETMRKLDRE